MITFKQKEYFWGMAMNGAMAAGSVIGIKQASDSQKQQEQANEEQARLMKKQNEALLNLAKQNPQQAVQAQEIKQSQFSNPNSIMNNGKAFAKDIGNMIISKPGRRLIGGSVIAGVGMGLWGYAGNKVIQHDMKKNGQSIPQQTSSERSYAIPGVLNNVGSKLKNFDWKNEGKWAKKELGNHLFGSGWTIGLGLMPVGMYMMGKKNQNNMVANTTPSQQNYSSIMTKSFSMGKMLANGGRKIVDYGTMFGSMGFGGTENMKKLGKHMMKQPNSSSWTKKTGEWLYLNPRTAAVATLVPAGFVGNKTWELGQNVVEKPARVIDKGAYAYQDSQDQSVQN